MATPGTRSCNYALGHCSKPVVMALESTLTQGRTTNRFVDLICADHAREAVDDMLSGPHPDFRLRQMTTREHAWVEAA